MVTHASLGPRCGESRSGTRIGAALGAELPPQAERRAATIANAGTRTRRTYDVRRVRANACSPRRATAARPRAPTCPSLGYDGRALNLVLLETPSAWADAFAALPAGGALPARTALVPSERHAHALRRAL